MTINVWGYLTEYESEREELLQAVDEVFRSGRLILGPQVADFEDRFAEYHGRAHGVGVDNGTNALVLALRALGVGQGDEVVTVSNTAAPTVVAIDAVGATPVFVDVDPDTYLMRVEQVEDVLSDRTRCLLPVHLYGQSVEMAPMVDLARQRKLTILEDCAQAHGARHHGRRVGGFGDAAAFSFYPTKVLGAYGDGGAVVLDDDDLHAALRRFRYYGMTDRYFVDETPGYNSRLDEVQAAILLRKLTRLDDYISARQAVADRYREGLADTELVLPAVAPGNEHVYYVYVVRHPDREAIMQRMKEAGILLNISYPWPVHTMTGFSHLDVEPGSLPVTERVAHEIFSLPMFPSLTPADQDRVIDELRRILDDNRRPLSVGRVRQSTSRRLKDQ